MDLGFETQFRRIILPAWDAYLAAELALTAAHEGGDEEMIDVARFRALREGGSVTFYLSHFADIIANEQPAQLPPGTDSVRKVRAWVSGNCRFLRTGAPVDDVQLLADVADALKHAKLTRELDRRRVASNDAVLVTSLGWGQGMYGEGKYGGPEQVIVLATTGPRVLSGMLQNVIDAWRTAMGWPLPEIGQIYE